MQNKNTVGMTVGFIMMVGGSIGVIWKAIESAIYKFQNPDYTDMRVFMENPQLAVWSIVFAIVCYAGYGIAKYNADARRR